MVAIKRVIDNILAVAIGGLPGVLWLIIMILCVLLLIWGVYGAGLISSNVTRWLFIQSYNQRVIVVDCDNGEREIAAMPAIDSEKRIDAAMTAITEAIALNRSQASKGTTQL